MTGFVCGALLALAPAAPVPPAAAPDPLAWGFLGVKAMHGSLELTEVDPNTPAERGGLQKGDVLVVVGDVRPRDFGDVIDHIAAFRPGTVLRIQVRRGDDLKTLTVRLGARPAHLGSPKQLQPE